MNNTLGCLASGDVVVDRINSHVKSHPVASELLVEALSRIASNGREFIAEEVNFVRVVGSTTCVPTHPHDEIRFAMRPNRVGLTRFVVGRSPEDCNTVVIILKKIEDDGSSNSRYVLITAYVGKKSPPEPWDTRTLERRPDPGIAAQESRDFWEHHALIWGSEEVVDGSMTFACSW
jgi:hypothetical protein